MAKGWQAWGLGHADRIRENWQGNLPSSLRIFGYAFEAGSAKGLQAGLDPVEVNIRRGLAVARSLEALKRAGLSPDVVYGHPGWGEMLFVRDVFPRAKIVSYCELYLHSEGQDLGFDPEFPERQGLAFAVQVQNMVQTQSLVRSDFGISPTFWQKSRYPEQLQSSISVSFDGIDCKHVVPSHSARLEFGGRIFDRSLELVTFVSRNLEPLRGFHVFMRSLPDLLRRKPHAQVLIAGGDGVSYSRPAPSGSYRAALMCELGSSVDWGRVHFLGKLSYAHYLSLLQISRVHVYLSYPFVLSWSVFEAMAVGCTLFAGDTEPVREVIQHGKNGFLVDFFDQGGLAEGISEAIDNPQPVIAASARQTIYDRYDWDKSCLPVITKHLES